MVVMVDEQIAHHKKLLAEFDTTTIDLDRAEAAVLARKYEAAAERGLYRAIREVREVQAEAKEIAEAIARKRLEEKPSEELGSSVPEPAEKESEESDVDFIDIEMGNPVDEVGFGDVPPAANQPIRGEKPVSEASLRSS